MFSCAFSPIDVVGSSTFPRPIKEAPYVTVEPSGIPGPAPGVLSCPVVLVTLVQVLVPSHPSALLTLVSNYDQVNNTAYSLERQQIDRLVTTTVLGSHCLVLGLVKVLRSSYMKLVEGIMSWTSPHHIGHHKVYVRPA